MSGISPTHAMIKRAIDLVVSGFLMVVLSPIMLLVAIAVLVGIGRPVLYRQRRPGLGETPFEMVKFRSMRDAVGRDGRLLPDSERLTELGSILRRTSLDELPELLNVWRGHMSLVGPRPLLLRYTEYMSREERRRYSAPTPQPKLRR